MNHLVKLQRTVDALFGVGVSNQLPKKIEFEFSRKNGRIRSVYSARKLLCTLRIDGGLAITVNLAQMFVKCKRFRENSCIIVDKDSKPFVEQGRSVFCSHVVKCGKNIKIGSDVPVLYGDKVIAVGRSVLSCKTIESMKRGVAVRTRDTLKQ
ncbi:MAG: PUA domain protein [Cenarchaeum symbiont of Oopsacas minuta]|nr:PUA domain protein [Cenarchaeum symbiont of Oopsacas minuta]